MTIIVNPNGYCEHLDKNDIAVIALRHAIDEDNITVNEILEKINK